MESLTFDTGALIALERRSMRMKSVVDAARLRQARITVPSPAIAEWWRGNSTVRRMVRAMIDVEPLDERVAKLAGEALASFQRGSAVDAAITIDAIVMASAAQRGGVVYTSDVDDLQRFAAFFPTVRVLGVSGRAAPPPKS